MKSTWLIVFAILLTISCNEKKPNQQNEKDTTNRVSEKKSDLTQYGMIANANPNGLQVGDKAPTVMLEPFDSEERSLESFYRDQPLVIIFYRGYWCPACNRHMAEFAERAIDIEQAGAKLVAITPESYENTEKTIDKTGIDFTVISDTDGSIMKAFDVGFAVTEEYQQKVQENLSVSIVETNTSQQAELPIPATYIVDTNGKIIYKHVNPDYNERASIDDILENLPEPMN